VVGGSVTAFVYRRRFGGHGHERDSGVKIVQTRGGRKKTESTTR
jgi:hypothetical protein